MLSLFFLVCIGLIRVDPSMQQMSISMNDLLDHQRSSEMPRDQQSSNDNAWRSSSPVLQSSGSDGEGLSAQSTDVVEGVIEAFMRKTRLQVGERTCIKNEIGAIAGDIMGTGRDVVTTAKALNLGNRSKNTMLAKQSSLVSVGVDSAMKIASLATLTTTLFRNCVHGDALAMLKKAAKHVANGTYLGDRFVVNGVDILHCLSDAVVAFENHRFYTFGSDIGTSMRKILLSKTKQSDRAILPEGYPKEKVMRKTTEGVMKGFFVKGEMVSITDDSYPDVNLNVDLHRCITGRGSRMFWKEAWMSAWDLFAQFAANGEQHGFGKDGFSMSANGTNGKWTNELMMALLTLPAALQKCGVSPGTQSMLLEAVQSVGHLHANFALPEDRAKADKVTKEVAKAVKAWTDYDYVTFGKELGMVLRELVMLSFPEKYYIDSSGHLQRDLVGLRSRGGFRKVVVEHRSKYHLFITLGFASSALVALLALRNLQPTRKNERAMETGTTERELRRVAPCTSRESYQYEFVA